MKNLTSTYSLQIYKLKRFYFLFFIINKKKFYYILSFYFKSIPFEKILLIISLTFNSKKKNQTKIKLIKIKITNYFHE